MDRNQYFEIKNCMKALDNLKKAFEDVASYAESAYIHDDVWDGADNYPFEWSFNEMPGNVEVWVDAVKRNIEAYEIHGTYDIVMYMSEIVPNWRDDNNLALVEVEGIALYDWYKDVLHNTDATKWNVNSFNNWVEKVQDADSVKGIYEYIEPHIISVKSFNWSF